jgi:hypothetical protein
MVAIGLDCVSTVTGNRSILVMDLREELQSRRHDHR